MSVSDPVVQRCCASFAISIDVSDGSFFAECRDRGVLLRQYGTTEDHACGNLLRLLVDMNTSTKSA